MHTVFSFTGYVLKRQGLSIGGKYRLFGLDNDTPLLFIEEQLKWIPLMTIVHVYADERKKQEILKLQTSKIDDVEMDVIDAESGQKIGGFGMAVDDLSEVIKDAWTITDADDKPIGKVFEKSTGQAVLREVLENALPQKLDIAVGETLVGELRQKSKMIGYELNIDFSMAPTGLLDRRLGLAAAIFVARHQAIEE
ncbi:MAG: hypothetical protein HY869_02625 [Chloroflexi bacterium]|nr:hypothetical protein [Chloroflexota bacterium]